MLRTQSPLLSPIVRSPDPATGGDGGGAGGKVPGLRARAAAGLGRRGGHTLLGRPLPRRHGALHRRGEQAAPLQRKGHQKIKLPSPPSDYSPAISSATADQVLILVSMAWERLIDSSTIGSCVFRAAEFLVVWSTRICYVMGSSCKLCRCLRGIFVPTVW